MDLVLCIISFFILLTAMHCWKRSTQGPVADWRCCESTVTEHPSVVVMFSVGTLLNSRYVVSFPVARQIEDVAG
jgi:hypothetical protein